MILGTFHLGLPVFLGIIVPLAVYRWYKGGMETGMWQYLRDDIADLAELDESLSKRGREGWELVSVIHTDPGGDVADNILAAKRWWVIFKKPT